MGTYHVELGHVTVRVLSGELWAWLLGLLKEAGRVTGVNIRIFFLGKHGLY
jgi:hypothetical protein